MQFDASSYIRPPKIGAASGFVLSARLLGAAPPDPSMRVLAALDRMRSRALEVQRAVKERARLRGRSLRAEDREFDGAYAAFRSRMIAHTQRPGNPRGPRAAELLADLLPEGLQFTKTSYGEQWFYSDTLLQRIDDEGLSEELEKLVGAEFLTDLRVAHATLGEALGIDAPQPDSAPGLSEAVNALAAAIADYGRVLAGEVDSEDEESVDAFLRAMTPRDTHRLNRGRRTASGQEPEAPPDEPTEQDPFELELPELPEPPADEAA